MTKFDNAHPNGIQIAPDLRKTVPAPVSVRMMTDEERATYGAAVERGLPQSQVSRVFIAYLEGKLPRHHAPLSRIWSE